MLYFDGCRDGSPLCGKHTLRVLSCADLADLDVVNRIDFYRDLEERLGRTILTEESMTMSSRKLRDGDKYIFKPRTPARH